MLPRLLPMLALPAAPFDAPEYSFEVKWDGIRALAAVEEAICQRFLARAGRHAKARLFLRNCLELGRSAWLSGSAGRGRGQPSLVQNGQRLFRPRPNLLIAIRHDQSVSGQGN